MTNPTAEQIQALFDRVAPSYDQLNTWLSLGQHSIWKQMAVNWSQAGPGATCLDICCGSGDLTQILARQVGLQGQVYGVDFSSQQLAIAHQKAKFKPWQDRIRWIEADALALPFADQTFDAITMGYGLRNVVDIPACLTELYRVLKPGAAAALLDFNRSRNPWIRGFQHWYLQTIVVPVAAQYGLTADYEYLETSLARFPQGPEQIEMGRSVGFNPVKHYEIAGGTMGVLVLERGLAESRLRSERA